MSEWKQNLIDHNLNFTKEQIKDTEKKISRLMKKDLSTRSRIGDIITFQRVNPMSGSDGKSTTKVENLLNHMPMLKYQKNKLSRRVDKTLKKPIIEQQSFKPSKQIKPSSEYG